MRDSRWREGKRRGEPTGGRDTVEEKKKLEPAGQSRSRRSNAGLARSLTQDTHTHTRTRTAHSTDTAARSTQHAAAPFLPSCQAKGRGKREGGRGRGAPGSQTLLRNWTRIGCLAGKGRLLSVLTDPAALVPDRGGTVDQSHAPSSRSTAHLVCNPHALLPWAPASLPTLPPTCSLMPSL